MTESWWKRQAKAFAELVKLAAETKRQAESRHFKKKDPFGPEVSNGRNGQP